MYKLTIEQKELLENKTVSDSLFFSPIQDINNDWFISKEEIDQANHDEFTWLKNLVKIEFISKEI